MNADSSRSHVLINIYLTSGDKSGAKTVSKLCLADLAGLISLLNLRRDGVLLNSLIETQKPLESSSAAAITD
jgi:hypothetical protein